MLRIVGFAGCYRLPLSQALPITPGLFPTPLSALLAGPILLAGVPAPPTPGRLPASLAAIV